MSNLPVDVHIVSAIMGVIERAQESKEKFGHEYLGVNHLMFELWEYSPFAVEELADIDDFNGCMLSLKDNVSGGGIGDPVDVDQLLVAVKIRVAAQGDLLAKLPDFIHVVLEKAGYKTRNPEHLKSIDTSETGATNPAGENSPGHPQILGRVEIPPGGLQVRRKPSIPTLLQYGTDLTRQAREGKLLPVVGRDEEIQLMIETLCRRTKRNPVLVGAAGVGKTAIVEGFAQRIVQGNVPELLVDATVILLQPSLIVSGGGKYGELEERMNPILAEATQEGVILFIDEVHAIVGAGGAAGTADIASLMKPALARGDIACIAATTDNEYRRYIEPDTALERRFQPIRVQEMSTAQVFVVLQVLRNDLKLNRNVDVSDGVLHRLVDYADKYMRNRTFPDKAVDLLEQCVANALARGDTDIDVSEAANVVERMIGIPLDIGSRIAAMQNTLAERRLLSDADIDALAGRLQVTMRGLDIRMVRPNAVLLLAGKAAKHGQALAEAICGALFKAVDRIVKIDMGRFTTHNDITLLLGAPPSYVGYNETLPIHQIKQYPWCVVLIDNVDTCHPGIQQVLGQALLDGYFTDGQNRKIYLSDVIMVLTAPSIERKNARTMGFQVEGVESDGDRALIGKHLDAAVADSIDVICFDMGGENEIWGDWLRSGILREVAERFGRLGVCLQWDDSIFDWIDTHCTDRSCQGELERLIDERLSPVILSVVKDVNGLERSLIVKCSGNDIVMEVV